MTSDNSLPYLDDSVAAANSDILSHIPDSGFQNEFNLEDFDFDLLTKLDANSTNDMLSVDPLLKDSTLDPVSAASQQTPAIGSPSREYLDQLASIGNSSPELWEPSSIASPSTLPNLNAAPKFLSTTNTPEVSPVAPRQPTPVNDYPGDVSTTNSQGILPAASSHRISNTLGPVDVASSHSLHPVASSSGLPPTNNALDNGFYLTPQPSGPPVPNYASHTDPRAPPYGAGWQQPWPAQNQHHANYAQNPQYVMPQGNSGPPNQYYPQYQLATKGKQRAGYYANPGASSGVDPLDHWLKEDIQPKTETVSRSRQDKKEHNPKADPTLFYTDEMPYIPTWGEEGAVFSYSRTGQWDHDRPFTAQQLRAYFDKCPRELRIWLQQCPAQCNNRVDPKGRKCRWAECPVKSRAIIAGWYRVAFDEFHELTSNGKKDPFHMAGSMHLWCFEQCFDPLEFFLNGKLRPDTRWLPKEDKTRNNPMLLNRDPDSNIVPQAVRPWIKKQRELGAQVIPRPHQESLSCRLVTYHLDSQNPIRQACRDTRNATKEAPIKKTADFHQGDLRFCVEKTAREKQQKQDKRKQIALDSTSAAIITPEANVGSGPAQEARGPNNAPNLTPLMQFLAMSAYEDVPQIAPAPVAPAAGVSFGPDVNQNEPMEPLRGKKRPRNNVEDDSDDDESSNDEGSLLDNPRKYKRPHKRIRIADHEDGKGEFERMLDRRRGRHGYRRRHRSFCSGDNPHRFRRGTLD